ncbi:MAG TPA: FliM/FliN family flagellar motor C-terminal domain-containing protein [Pirellulaceae bacterium]|nr:FliM/FliN family flagellar motor C-terminal domain-containing protein [Pirellulaceae bacterium]HMO90905.1 FliM/FliN family flagellar motor C-terminal domain-containing protein [Pirellulaceae bacterium]HMP68619.1 FliM/FliN family flagellar motor C-terminal domain-containing protein [Pirellulaceae bacterium]
MTTKQEDVVTENVDDSTNLEVPESGVEIQKPQYQEFEDSGDASAKHEITRFADIAVTVSAELGRASISIEKLLTLGKGSVLELDRLIDSPVELVAQGIPLANGEVVVVDNHFAIRILEVYPRNRRGETLKGEKLS